MFPNDPFDSDRGIDIRKLINAGNPDAIGLSTVDQSIGQDGDKLIITADISKFRKENITVKITEKSGKQFLNILSRAHPMGMESMLSQIQLNEKVARDSAKATENNGVLTVEIDIVESEEDNSTSIDIK